MCLIYHSICFLLILSSDVESDYSPRTNQNSFGAFYSNIRGLKLKMSELSIASKELDILMYSET